MSQPTQSSNRTWLLIVIGVMVLAASAVIVIGLVLSRSVTPAPTMTSAPTATPSPAPTTVLPTPTLAATPLPTSGFLTVTLVPPPSLAELATQFPELADILSEPELNTVYKDFLVAYQQGGEQAAIALARQRGILTPQNEIRATLILDGTYTAALLQQLESTGIIVETAYETQVDIAVPLAVIQSAIDSGQPEAVFKQLTELEHVIRVKAPQRNFPGAAKARPWAEGVIGQGVALIGADQWHAAGLTGAGVKVGILDCGFKDYQDLLGRELPDRVVAKTFVRGLGDPHDSDEPHGTAVAEIVHEIAPDAELYLADYGCQGTAKGAAVEWLLEQGVQIISNSTGSPEAPMDGTGNAVALVKKATKQGVLWINSSGNEALQHYRGEFTDTDHDQLNEFEGVRETLSFVSVESEAAIILRWDDWATVDQDLDLFLLDQNGDSIAASQEAQAGQPGDEPVELIEYYGLEAGERYRVAVYADRIDRPVWLDVYIEGNIDEMTPVTAGYSLITPADAREAMAVGAVNWETDQVTSYSSRGPTDDGRTKPDLVAPSEVDNVTYRRFDGTSASAPHVAGAAALVWGAQPDWDRQQVWDYLVDNALDYGPNGPDDEYGAGRLQLAAPPGQAITATAMPTPLPSETPTPAQTPIVSMTPSPTLPPAITPMASPTPGSTADISQWLGVFMIGGGLVLLVVVIIVIARLRRRPASGLPRSPAPQTPPSYAPPNYPTGPVPGTGMPTPYTPIMVAPSAVCPHCGKPVRVGAKFCAACGKSIAPAALPVQWPPGPATQPPQPGTLPPPQVQVYCKHCHQPLRAGAKFCAKCGTRQ